MVLFAWTSPLGDYIEPLASCATSHVASLQSDKPPEYFMFHALFVICVVSFLSFFLFFFFLLSFSFFLSFCLSVFLSHVLCFSAGIAALGCWPLAVFFHLCYCYSSCWSISLWSSSLIFSVPHHFSPLSPPSIHPSHFQRIGTCWVSLSRFKVEEFVQKPQKYISIYFFVSPGSISPGQL